MNSTPTSTVRYPALARLAAAGVAQGHDDAAVHTDAAMDATKEGALRMVAEQARAHGSLARACAVVEVELGIPRATLRGWARQAQVEAAEAWCPTRAEHDELEALRAEVRRLREANAVLQATATFLAGASRSRSA